MPTFRRLPRRTDALWLLCLALYILAGAAIAPFHGDESTLMIMGRDYHYLAVEGDLSKLLYDGAWRVNPHEQHLRIVNGAISKYIYGWLQALNGIDPGDLNRNWHWGRGYDWNAGRGALPDGDLLRQARLASALQLALAAAACFQFVKICVNRPTAWLASALFALQPNMLINGRRAMMEGSHILGMMLLLMAAACLIRERRWRHYVLLGFCGGLAIAAKHPNAIICALVYLACAWKPLGQLAGDWRRSSWQLLGLALAGFITILVFLLLNPAWWDDPLAVAAAVVAERQKLLGNQVDLFGGYQSLAQQASGFFEFAFVGARQYFEVAAWNDYPVITAQIAEYESSGLGGLLFYGASGRLGLAIMLLCGYGAYSLARDEGIMREIKILLGIWMAGSALWTLWLTPLPWARYYLPLLPAVILLLSCALIRLVQLLTSLRYASADGVARLD